MNAWWHRLADRPLDAQRLQAFAAASCVLLLVACVLAFTAGNRAPADPTRSVPTGADTQAAVVASTFDDGPDAARAPGDERAAVVRQARRFLRGYLSYLYGQGPARALRGSTDVLRRRLALARLRVPPAARRRHPRVVRVVADPLDRGHWHVVATIADGGVARYPIELLVTTGADGARVAEVSSE